MNPPIATPWGRPDSFTVRAPGITWYSTPSHGGFHLSDDRLVQLQARIGPVTVFRPDWPNWFEEDCDWSHVAVAFPELFTTAEVEAAKATSAWLLKRNQAS